MIAFAGALRLEAGERAPDAVHVTPRWDMATLAEVRRDARADTGGDAATGATSAPR